MRRRRRWLLACLLACDADELSLPVVVLVVCPNFPSTLDYIPLSPPSPTTLLNLPT